MAISALISGIITLSALAPQGEGEGPRVVLLGGSTTLSGESPAGIKYADWIKECLGPVQGETIQLIQAATKGGTVKEGREAARKFFPSKPEVFVLGFGLEDALRLSPQDFTKELEGLLGEIAENCPESKILLVTSTPLEEGHPRAEELEKSFVEPLRELAKKRSLPLADHHDLLENALQSGETPEQLFRDGGIQLTGRGNLLAGRETARSLKELLKADSEKPSEAPSSEKAGPTIADLEPFLEVWVKDLEPLWLGRAREKDPDIQIGGFRALLEEQSPPKDFLPALLALLKHSSSARDGAVDLLFDAIAEGGLERDVVIASLFSMIRNDGLNSLTALTVLPIVESIVTGTSARPSRSSRIRNLKTTLRAISSARAGTRTPSAIKGPFQTPPYKFTGEDLALLANALSSREETIRSSATKILLNPPGEPGLEMVFEKVRKSPEDETLYFLDQILNLYPVESQKDRILEMARKDPREDVRRYCRERIFGLPSGEIPLEILREFFTRETGSFQERAAKILASRGQDGLDVFIPSLRAAEEEQVWYSRMALLYMGLYGRSEDIGEKALSALQAHFLPDRRNDLLIYLDAALRKMSLPVICLPQPAQATPRSPRMTIRSSIRSRTSRSVQSENWPADLSEPQVERLKGFLPALKESFNRGTDEEKELAEEILLSLWRRARDLEEHLRGKPETIKITPADVPIDKELIRKLRAEAWESLKNGDSRGFFLKARQALAAGASHSTWNSFAWEMATSARNDLWNPELAEEWVREAIARGGRNPAYLDTLATALAGQGKFEEALDLEVEALQKINKEKPGPFTARAILYLSKKPYRKKS